MEKSAMKKSVSTLLACILFASAGSNVFTQDKSSSGKSLSECISIKEGSKVFRTAENPSIVLDDYAFDIAIDNISKDDVVCLFAFYNEDYMSKYQLPVKTEDTELFCPGCGLAESLLDPEQGYSLSINKPSTFHYLFNERRLNYENSCVIPVRKITDPTGNFAGKICFSIFVDYNGNKIIEENEYAAFMVSFSPRVSFDANDFKMKTEASWNNFPINQI